MVSPTDLKIASNTLLLGTKVITKVLPFVKTLYKTADACS